MAFLSVLLSPFDDFTVMILLLSVIGGVGTAAVLYRFVGTELGYGVGIVAGLLFLSPLYANVQITTTTRPFAVLLGMTALLVHSPVIAGALVICGALISQYVGVFLLPVALIGIWERGWTPKRDVLRFLIGGLLIGILAYGSLLFVWGWDSLIGAIEYSLLFIVDYSSTSGGPLATGMADASVVENPLYGVASVAFLVGRQLYFLPVGIAILRLNADRSIRIACLVGVVVSFLPFLVRASAQYVIYPLPWLAILAALGYRDLIEFGVRRYNDAQ